MTASDPDVAGRALPAVRRAYLDALLAPDTRRAWAVVEDAAAAGVPSPRLYLDVVAPAMEDIGRLWETARIGVAQEHLATQITQTVLARLAPELDDGVARVRARGLALVAGTPGELHALGGRMVADFLEGAGWEVLLLGPDTPAQDIVDATAQHRPQVVALSTALPGNLLAAGAVFAALARLEPAPLLVAGGRAYAGDPGRAALTGADLFVADLQTLVAELDRRVRRPTGA